MASEDALADELIVKKIIAEEQNIRNDEAEEKDLRAEFEASAGIARKNIIQMRIANIDQVMRSTAGEIARLKSKFYGRLSVPLRSKLAGVVALRMDKLSRLRRKIFNLMKDEDLSKAPPRRYRRGEGPDSGNWSDSGED